jgi:hypothetical protein
MSDVHSDSDLGARRNRSQVTNGRLLPNVDGRSTWARRCRDLIGLHVADKGGDASVSEAERAIIRRAAVLITELEIMEARFAVSDGASDIAELDAYQRAANSLRRLLESVGIQRRARDVTPTIETYLGAKPRPASETAAGATFDAEPSGGAATAFARS